MKKGFLCLLVLMLCLAGTACGDSVTRMHYVFGDWTGDYTGQVDTNSIPFGYGLFESQSPMDGELWHYIGAWEKGLPSGEGAVYFENGNMQKGTFADGKLVEGLQYSVTGLSALPVTLERAIEDTDALYIGNKNSMKFHLPTCRSVQQMKEKNKVEFMSREEAVDRGFRPCGDCNP